MRLQRADFHLVGVGLGGGDGLRLCGQGGGGGFLGILQIFFEPVVDPGQVGHGRVEFLDALVRLGQIRPEFGRIVPTPRADGPGLLQQFLQLGHPGLRLVEVTPVAVHETGQLVVITGQLFGLHLQGGSFLSRQVEAAVLVAQRHGVRRQLLCGGGFLLQPLVGRGQLEHGRAALFQGRIGLGQLLLVFVEPGGVGGLLLGVTQIDFQGRHAGLSLKVAAVLGGDLIGERLLFASHLLRAVLRLGQLLPERPGIFRGRLGHGLGRQGLLRAASPLDQGGVVGR